MSLYPRNKMQCIDANLVDELEKMKHKRLNISLMKGK